MKNAGALFSVPIVAMALFAAFPSASASAAGAAPAVTPLPCHASMSNSHPRDYTTVYVNVHTVGYASVTTIAHYKTTNHKKSGKAGKKLSLIHISEPTRLGMISY